MLHAIGGLITIEIRRCLRRLLAVASETARHLRDRDERFGRRVDFDAIARAELQGFGTAGLA